ncbi:MAG: branched-chain amino acid aminotransferase [Chloroflexota bacterium]|nr:branched-chain amino acid aminotransferase [Chloroflexota bacterium]
MTPVLEPPDYAWLNGRLVGFDECVVHARSQGAFWGANVFEGLRGYWHDAERQLSVFRLDDHLRRLGRSMKSLHMPVRYTDDEITAACVDLLRANRYRQDVHLCVVSYFGMGANFDPLCHTDDVGMHITATRAPRSPRFSAGAAASVSSWRRISDDSMPPRIKTGANYHNSRLAQHEAVRNGFDTTLLLNQRGSVAEAPGACVVIYRNGRLVTPPGTSGVLEGITLSTVDVLAQAHLGLSIERREVDRTELYVADELFLCGTLAEILPITSIDRLPVGSGVPGPVTRQLQERYDHTVRVGAAADPAWSTPVWPAVPQPVRA